MEARDSARQIAIARAVIGAGLVAAPGLAARLWLGEDAASPATKVAARGLGARDVALAVGTLRSLDGGGPVRGWIEGGVLADVADFAATVLAARHLPRLGVLTVMGLAGYGAYEGMRIAQAIDADRPPTGMAGPQPA